MSKKKIWILAEPESFFLPYLAAKLAQAGYLAGIIEIQFPTPVHRRFKQIRKILDVFGLITFLIVAAESILAIGLNLLFSDRYYSLGKAAKKFHLPFYKCRGFKDPLLINLLETQIRKVPVLVQVGKLVPKNLVEKYYLINKHCSLLPSYAGVYPVFWAMLHSEKEQGVSIHFMNEKFDEGMIIAQQKIKNSGSFFEIYHRLYDETSTLLFELLQSESEWKQIENKLNPAQFKYFSYPTSADRIQFLEKGNVFGHPLRIHPKIKGALNLN